MSAYRDQSLAERLRLLEREILELEGRLPAQVWPQLPGRVWSELMRASRVAKDLSRSAPASESHAERFAQALGAKRDALVQALAGAEALRRALAEIPPGFPEHDAARPRLLERLSLRWASLRGAPLVAIADRAREKLLEIVGAIGRDVTVLDVPRSTAAAARLVFGDVPVLASVSTHAARTPFVSARLRTLAPAGAVPVRVARMGAYAPPTIEVIGAGDAEAAVRGLVDRALPGLAEAPVGFRLRVGSGRVDLTLHGEPELAAFAAGAELLRALRGAPVASWVDAIR